MILAMNFKLPKSERLHAEKLIKELFNEGSSFFLYPVKVVYLIQSESPKAANQVLFSVSKKKIRKASGRNFVKRRLREAYRLNKQLLSARGISLGFIFVGKPDMSFGEIEPRIKMALEKLEKELSQNHSDHASNL